MQPPKSPHLKTNVYNICSGDQIKYMMSANWSIVNNWSVALAEADYRWWSYQLEEARTHKSAKTHAGSFVCLVTFDLLTPKQMGLQDSWLNICVSSLVILAAAVLIYRAEK